MLVLPKDHLGLARVVPLRPSPYDHERTLPA